MTRDELTAKCNIHLGAATDANEHNDHEHYAEHMSALLDLLIEELVGDAPETPDTPPPERNES